MSQKIYTNLDIKGNTTIGSIANATTDTDKFLVSDNGLVKYRTGAEMLSDLGINAGAPTSSIQHQVKAAVAISKGQAVYVSSADGTNMIVSLASNASEATSSKTMGLLADTVAINGFSNVVAEGLLAGLNTSTAAAGDPVWLGTGGNLIYGLINKPYAPAHLVFIGIVTRSNNVNGEIFVKVQNGFELNEIHDVDLKTTVPINGHILGFDGSLWVNKTIAGWLGYTPYNASNPAGYISAETNTFLADGGDPNTHPGSSRLIFTGQVSSTGVLGMPAIDNSNSFLNINRHPGEYNSQLGFSSDGNMYYRSYSALAIDSLIPWRKFWDSGNDGSGSGLDADLLDGNHASAFALASHTHPYDNYQYWNLKTNGVQRTTITSNGTLDLVAGTNVSLSYGAGGVVTISSTDTNTIYTHPAYTTRSIDTSGAQVIDVFTSDAIGSVTNITTRTMTLADLGYTGATNANFYTLPTATSTVLGGVKLFSDTVQSTIANAVSATASRTYGVQVNAAGQMLVNVPWTDTVYTHPAYTARNIDTSGAQVIDIITSDAIGSVTNITTRTLTPADIGAADASHTHTFDSLTAKTGGTGTYQTSGEFIQNNGRYVRDSYYRTISGRSDLYTSGTDGWYTAAQITLSSNCGGAVLYGTLYDHRYNGADSYQIAVVARSECDFTSNNQSHYVNVGCTIIGSTNNIDYRGKIRVILTTSTTDNRTYQLQFYETAWNSDTWQLESNGWTIYTGPQTAGAQVGTPIVNYVSNLNADYLRANTATHSPIYYDSNDTSYYGDFAATSDSAIRVRGGALHGPNPTWGKYLLIGGDGRQNYTNDVNTASVCTTDGNLHIDSASTKSLYLNYYDGDIIYLGGGASNIVSSINNDGSHRPQIIYDYNNTGYYINIDGGSNIYDLSMTGANNKYLTINPGNGYESMVRYIGGSGSSWYVGKRTANQLVGTESFHFYSEAAGITVAGVDTAGNIHAYASMRSPIYYDSNNTAYYLDPASTSNLYNITANTFVKSGGTSSQFLKADGSVDSNSYYLASNPSGYITSSGSTSGYSALLLAEDNRVISPSELAANRLRFGFTSWNNNNSSPYADFLHMRSYQDSSGGLDNLVMFRKDAIGMRIWQQTYGSSTAYSSYKDIAFTDGTNASGTWGISITGNAGTATTLQTARNINGTSFNGSADITTANWGTARTITIGSTGKSVNGSANVSWTLAEIGAASSTHTHDLVRYSLAAPAFIDTLTTTNFRTTLFGSTTNGYQISTSRWNSVPTPLTGLNQYGTMFAWAGSDTQGFIAMDYSAAALIVGGGNGDNINWSRRVLVEQSWTNSKYFDTGGEIYGTRFYDANNSAYYVDPADTTTSANFQSKITIQGGSSSATTMMQVVNSYGSPSIQTYYGAINTTSSFYVGNPAGTLYDAFGQNARFSLYYDRDNTAYYVDPATTSVLNRLSISFSDATYQSGITVTNTNTGAQAIAGVNMFSGVHSGSINMFSSGYMDLLNQNTTNGTIQFRPKATVSMYIDNVSSTSRVTIGGSNPASHPLRVTQQVSNVSIYADYDIVAYSDQSVKENVRPIENVLDRVNKSRGVLYDRIDSGEKNNIGFIAQELEVEFPELVVTNEDNTKAVKYQNAVAVLFEAVKEQQKQIEELKELVNKLITK